jgi:hypothetical protein
MLEVRDYYGRPLRFSKSPRSFFRQKNAYPQLPKKEQLQKIISMRISDDEKLAEGLGINKGDRKNGVVDGSAGLDGAGYAYRAGNCTRH